MMPAPDVSETESGDSDNTSEEPLDTDPTGDFDGPEDGLDTEA